MDRARVYSEYYSIQDHQIKELLPNLIYDLSGYTDGHQMAAYFGLIPTHLLMECERQNAHLKVWPSLVCVPIARDTV